MRVRSFAAGAGVDDLNLVMWKWDSERPARVGLIDDDDRFSGGLGVIVSESIVGYRYHGTLHPAHTGRQHKARVIRYPSCPVGAWCKGYRMRGSPKVTMRRNEPCVRKREAGRSRRRERRREPCTELAYQPYRKPCSAKLNPSREQRHEFKERHGPDFEKWWREQIGHTLDCLAQSEARYLARSPGVDAIRSRLAEAQQGGNGPGGPRSPREQKRHIADLRSRLRDRFSDGPLAALRPCGRCRHDGRDTIGRGIRLSWICLTRLSIPVWSFTASGASYPGPPLESESLSEMFEPAVVLSPGFAA